MFRFIGRLLRDEAGSMTLFAYVLPIGLVAFACCGLLGALIRVQWGISTR
jgi:hypothetical protein